MYFSHACSGAGAHFTNDVSVVILKLWKLVFKVTQYHVPTKFCSLHECTAVVPLAKCHSDRFALTWIRAEVHFHRNWITMEKSFVKRAQFVAILFNPWYWPLWEESTGHRWISLTKSSDTELRFFSNLRLNKLLSKQSRRRWFETSWRSLWRRCNVVSRLLMRAPGNRRQ